MLNFVRKLPLILILSALAACGEGETVNEAPPVKVGAAHPQVERVTDWSRVTGRFEATDQVDVRARVSGFLEEVLFEDGQKVEAGDLLFVIDRRPFEAELLAAEGALSEMESTLSQASKELARAGKLVDIGAVSSEEVEALEASVTRGEAAVASARARVRLAELNLEFTEVRAPTSGRVSDRRLDPGNLISGGTGAADVLTTIVSYDPIHFVFEISEKEALDYFNSGRGEQHTKIEIKLLGDENFSWNSEVTFTDNALDYRSGTLKLRATMENPNERLRPGMYGEARLSVREPYMAVTVPETAIVSDATRRFVYIVGEDNKVDVQSVELGTLINSRRVIDSGLSEDDLIVVSGTQSVRPGMTVAIEQENNEQLVQTEQTRSPE